MSFDEERVSDCTTDEAVTQLINGFERLQRTDDITPDIRRNIAESLDLDERPTEEETIQEITRIFQDDYPEVRNVHLWNESVLRITDWPGITNLRDAVEHISHIFMHLDNGEPESARPEVAEMAAHLYRAGYEGAQFVSEKKLYEAEKKRLPKIFYSLTLIDAMPNSEYRRRVDEINQQIALGRQHKPVDWDESVAIFKDAGEDAIKLESETPSRREVYWRMAIFGIALLALLLTGIGLVLNAVF